MISDLVALAAAHPEPAAYITAALAAELWIGGVTMNLKPLEQLGAGAAGLVCWYAALRLALVAGHPAPVIVAITALTATGLILWFLRS